MPKKILITYTNHNYYHSCEKLIKSAKKFNDFDEYVTFTPWDIDEGFRKKNHEIFKCQKGDGYWLWKPYIIKKTLERMEEGDILFYMDAGSYFIHSMEPIIDLFNTTSVMCFNIIGHLEKKWTKRDCFIKLNADNPKYYNSIHRLGGFHLWKKNNISKKLVNDWLIYAQDPHIITDAPSINPNYPEFIENRHDQSIFSLLTKKYNLPSFRDPSQHGNSDINKYNNSDYPQIIELTQKRSSRRDLRRELIFLNLFIIKCYMFYKKKIWLFKNKLGVS